MPLPVGATQLRGTSTPRSFLTDPTRPRVGPLPAPTESRSVKILVLASAVLFAAAPAIAQSGAPRQPGTGGTVIQNQPNTTGNDRDVVISRGATGADTATTDSAAGGNANKPEQAVPNSSAGGGSGGSN